MIKNAARKLKKMIEENTTLNHLAVRRATGHLPLNKFKVFSCGKTCGLIHT